MTAHMISQGLHPSMHPGVLRKIGSFIGIMAPVPATARELFGQVRTNVGIARPYIAWLVSHQLATREGGNVALTDRGQALMGAYLERERGGVDG